MTRRPWQVDFDCSGCGACCRAVGCDFLEGNRCSIYLHRPDFCRVGYSYDPNTDLEQYLEANRQACKELELLFPSEAPMSWAYSSRSMQRLNTCHPDLILLMTEALADPACPSDISVLEGYRDEERQNQMVAEGKSQLKYPRSFHNRQPSMAVDVAPYVGGITWDWDYYYPLAEHIKAVWARLQSEGRVSADLRLEWGGDWTSFADGPHWQLVQA